MSARLAIVGAGVMGEAIARGVISAGWEPSSLVVADVYAERVKEISRDLGVSAATDAADAASRAEATLLAVKPQEAAVALDELAGSVGASGLISIVAGLRIASMEERLGAGASVVRAMPNSPARVGKGVTVLSHGMNASAQTRALAEEVFAAVGPVFWLDEDKLDAVTALSGSGPAYVYYLAEAMIEASIALGLERSVAEALTYETIEGAGRMLTTMGLPPQELRAQVTSRAGTTEAAIKTLEEAGVRESFARAIDAATRRAQELGS